MNAQTEDENAALDCPLPWPRPGEGYGLGRPPFRDEQTGYWVVSTYSDVERVLLDPETFSSEYSIGPDREDVFAPLQARASEDPSAAVALNYSRFPIVSDDGEVHRRERSYVGKAFTPKRVRKFELLITSLCDELTDAMVGRREVPFLEGFAVPLPVKVIAHGLGVPAEDYLLLKRWSDGFQGIIGVPQPCAEVMETFVKTAVEFTEYITPLIEERREAPGEDLISLLAAEGSDGRRQSTEEVLSHTKALLLGGNKTTTAALAGTMLYLVRSPDLQETVRADPTRIPALVEEGLRLSTPVQVMYRTATVDTEVAGVTVAASEHVMMRCAAADRDEAQFDNPLGPRVDRPDGRHLAFGRGIHVCPGAPLARAELRIALQTLLARTSSITLSDRDDPVVAVGNLPTATLGELYIDVHA